MVFSFCMCYRLLAQRNYVLLVLSVARSDTGRVTDDIVLDATCILSSSDATYILSSFCVSQLRNHLQNIACTQEGFRATK